MQMNQAALAPRGENSRGRGSVADALEQTAELLYARWTRAVDLLYSEAVRRRQISVGERESARSARRLKNLQRIVRKVLADYHAIELERQRHEQGRSIQDAGEST